MQSIRIESVASHESVPDIKVEVTCECGKVHLLSSLDGGHPSFCGACERAFFVKTHDNHFHVRSIVMSRGEIIQQSYGRMGQFAVRR